MGMSMKVERSTLAQVKERFAMNKRKKEEVEKKKEYDFDARMKEMEEEYVSCLANKQKCKVWCVKCEV